MSTIAGRMLELEARQRTCKSVFTAGSSWGFWEYLRAMIAFKARIGPGLRFPPNRRGISYKE